MNTRSVMTKELAGTLLKQLRPIDVSLGIKLLHGSPLAGRPGIEELLKSECKLFWLAALTSYAQGQAHSGLPIDSDTAIGHLFDTADENVMGTDWKVSDVLGDGGSLCQDFPGLVVTDEDLANEPEAFFVYRKDSELIYLQRWYRMEKRVGAFVSARLARNPWSMPAGFAKHFREFYPPKELTDNPWQAAACFAALRHDFSIITGGPGTGKTTTVTRLIGLLLSLPEGARPKSIHLVAQTGKAAERMRESLSGNFDHMLSSLTADRQQQLSALREAVLHPASTIHSFLGCRHSAGFRYNAGNPVTCDVLIVDESSMVDLELFVALLDALPAHCRLILLGDKNQLAAVGTGNVFSDLTGTKTSAHGPLNAKSKTFREQFEAIASCALPVYEADEALCGDLIIELSRSYRFSADSPVGYLARLLIEEERLPSDSEEGIECCYFTEDWKGRLCDSLASYKQALASGAEADALLEEIAKIRVLCAVRRGDQGVLAVNRLLSEYVLGRKSDSVPLDGLPFIIRSNDKNLGLANGDCGVFRKNREGELLAWLPPSGGGGELRAFNPFALPEWEAGFALTIHQSQGSEYESVLIVLPEMKRQFISWELVYTAITRGKRNVSLIMPAGLAGTRLERIERRSGLRQEVMRATRHSASLSA